MKTYLHKNNDECIFSHSRTKKITKGELYRDDTLFCKTNIKAKYINLQQFSLATGFIS